MAELPPEIHTLRFLARHVQGVSGMVILLCVAVDSYYGPVNLMEIISGVCALLMVRIALSS